MDAQVRYADQTHKAIVDNDANTAEKLHQGIKNNSLPLNCKQKIHADINTKRELEYVLDLNRNNRIMGPETSLLKM